MKKALITFCLILFVTGLAAAQTVGGTMYVAVKTVTLKASTWIFAANRGTLSYGDRVTVQEVSGKNVRVQSAANSSISGWTAAANLSSRQIVAGATSSASASEVALAGKGFNQEVEDSYKTQHQELDFSVVDRVEAITVTEADLRQFLQAGRLTGGTEQ
jgi:hypothetical protein